MRCSTEEIVNAYDNTILYTDHILASVARLLEKHQDRIAGAMIYMSDHGESLGENGIYLHGAPYAIAPKEQTQVPFLAWFSKPYQAAMGIDTGCLAKDADEPRSHDNLFHTVLGMMDVQTKVYNRNLDAFAVCTRPDVREKTTPAYHAAQNLELVAPVDEPQARSARDLL